MIIDQLPSVSSAADADEIVVEIGTTTYKIKKSDFVKELMRKSGGTFTGDVAFDGVVTETNRMASARLSAAGWYRVAKFNGVSQYSPLGALGALIRFNIVVYGNDGNNGNHQVDYISTYGTGNRKFVNEQSNGVDTKISKIRCTSKDNDFFIDVYFNSSAATDVYVYWDFYTSNSFLGNLVTQNLETVSSAPVGETVLSTYDFSSDGVFFRNVFSNGIQLFGLLSGGTAIASNADLNSYTDPGVYTCTPTVAATLTNSSFTTTGFKMLVMDNVAGTTARWQICLASYDNCVVAIRWRNASGVWQAWKRLTPA